LYPEKSREDSFVEKKNKKAKKPSWTTELTQKPTLGEQTEHLACSFKQNKVRKEVRLCKYNEVTMGCMRGKQGRSIKFKDSFSKAKWVEDRLVTRTFLDNRAMVFWENSFNGSWDKAKNLNVSFWKYLCSVAAHSVTKVKRLSKSCFPNCASLGQASPLQNSMTETERAQKHSHEETMPVEAALHRGSSTQTCRRTSMMSDTRTTS